MLWFRYKMSAHRFTCLNTWASGSVLLWEVGPG